MKKIIRQVLLVFFTVSLFIVSGYAWDVVSPESGRKNSLWKISSKTAVVYTLGSIHLMKKEHYPLDKKLEDAFQKSEILVVEANINASNEKDMKTMIEKAMYPADDLKDVLEKHISKETYGLFKKELKEFNLPAELFCKQKPWFISMTLEVLVLMQSGYDPNVGIDMHFISLAGKRKMKITELESLEYQLNLLSGFSEEEQELFLLYTLKNLKILSAETDKVVKAWKAGDTNTIETIMLKSSVEDKRLLPIDEKIIYKRNREMVTKIEEFLKTDKVYFVVVGVGHLVGDRGIVEILKKKGYNVEQE